PPAVSGDPPADAVATVAAMLAKARRPLLMIGRVSSDAGDFHRRVQLAERLDARVLTDLKTGASFPTKHRLHPHAPGLYVSGDAGTLIREADVIVSLDWIDLAGSLRQACGGEMPVAKIVQCSARSPHRLRRPRRAQMSSPPTQRTRNTFPSTNWHRRPPTRSRRIVLPTSACRSAGPENIADSSTRRTTSALTAAVASAPGRAWRGAPRWLCGVANACRWPFWATANTSWA